MKTSRPVVLIMVVFMCLFAFVPAFASASDEAENFLKAQKLHGLAADNDDEPFAAAKDDNDMVSVVREDPTGSMIPTDDGAVSDPTLPPAGPAETSKLYYCVIPKKHAVNLEALCNKYGAPMMVYRSFRQLIVLQKVGCVVTVNPANKYFISQLKKYYHAKPLKNVSIRVKVKVNSIPYLVHKKAEDFMAADFGACDAALQAMIKNPYGKGTSTFKAIARTFPGLLDKVTVKAKAHWLFGKDKKVLFNPDVTIEVLALNMNGKNKNVTLFHDEFHFKTIKHAANYNWNK